MQINNIFLQLLTCFFKCATIYLSYKRKRKIYGRIFGAVAGRSVISDVFFGTDYHSHLGTRRAGVATYDTEKGIQREIHNIENSPFRTKFGKLFDEMTGTTAIGCIVTTILSQSL